MKTCPVSILAIGLIAFGGCSQKRDSKQVGPGNPFQFPLSKTDPAKAPPFTVDVTKDYRIEFGRGSGWHGLDTVAFSRDGATTLHRLNGDGGWQRATLTLDGSALARILETLRAEGLMQMAAAYHADVHDGTQWVLWITQGEHSKSIYFNNHFPKEVLRFAEVLDSQLSAAGFTTLRWEDVPIKEARLHEMPLWNSIRK